MTGETLLVHMLHNAMPRAFAAHRRAQSKSQVLVVDVNGILHRLYSKVENRNNGDLPTYGQFLEALQDQLLTWWSLYGQLDTVVLVLDRQVPQLKNRVRSDRAVSRVQPSHHVEQWRRDPERLREPMPPLKELMYNNQTRLWLYELIAQGMLSGLHINSQLYDSAPQPLLPVACRLVLDGVVWDNQPNLELTQTLELSRDAAGSMSLRPLRGVNTTLYNEADTRLGFWCAHYHHRNCLVMATDMDVFVMLMGVCRAQQAQKECGELMFVSNHKCYVPTDKKSEQRQVHIDMRRLYWQLDVVCRACWPSVLSREMNCVDLLALLTAMCGTDYTQPLGGRLFRLSSHGHSMPQATAALERHMVQDHPELHKPQRDRLLSQIKSSQKQLDCAQCPPAVKQNDLWSTFWSSLSSIHGSLCPVRTSLHPHHQDQCTLVKVDSQTVQNWISRTLLEHTKGVKRELSADMVRRLCAQYCFYLCYAYNARLPHYPHPSGFERDDTAPSYSLYGWQLSSDQSVVPAEVNSRRMFTNEDALTAECTPQYSHL